MNPYLIVLVTFCSTFIGGLLALRFGKHIHWLNALSAGILLGAAFFELLPEAIELNHEVRLVFGLTVLAFIIFHLLQRTTLLHHCNDADEKSHKHVGSHAHEDTRHIGVMGAAGLALHSFLDGSAIGLGFAVSPAVGVTVAIAVIAHDFGDGVSTVTLMLRHKNTRAKTFLLLAIDAIAPLIGAIIFINLAVPEAVLGALLACFAGFFLYLSTSDLLPEAQRDTRSKGILFATIAGAAIMFAITFFLP
jgi:ZIP family zinc transporter